MSIHDFIHGCFVGGYIGAGIILGARPDLYWIAAPSLLLIFAADFTHREAITPDRWDQ